jgi:tetratricopeptide (TPR) repeat protein
MSDRELRTLQLVHRETLNKRKRNLLEAEKYAKFSLKLCQTIFENTQHKTFEYRMSHIHNNLGLILEDLKKYVEAEKSYGIALKLRREELGGRDYLVGQSLLNLAACYDWQEKNDDQVERMLLECCEIWETLLDSNHPEILYCYEHLAKFYNRKRRFKKAIYYYEKTIENCRAREDNSILFYQTKLNECIKRSKTIKPRQSEKTRNKGKGFG